MQKLLGLDESQIAERSADLWLDADQRGAPRARSYGDIIIRTEDEAWLAPEELAAREAEAQRILAARREEATHA